MHRAGTICNFDLIYNILDSSLEFIL